MKNTTRIILLCFVVLLFFNSAYAEGYGNDLDVGRIHVKNEICYFGIIGTLEDVCASYSRHLKFDVSTSQGKLMLSMIISAKLAGKKIDIWYTSSSTPGTTESTGCTEGTMAVLHQVSIE